jgi:hypothetical protein
MATLRGGLASSTASRSSTKDSDISGRNKSISSAHPSPRSPQNYTWEFLARPGRARPAHEPYWMGVGRDLEARENFFGPSPARNAVFIYFTL